jgi:prepilin-type N-terminal cleavage/methylation domain-containing protein
MSGYNDIKGGKREMTPETFISLKKRTKRPAFTLIELLVVIAIVALLLSIIVPAIKRAKESGKRAVCLNNTKSLALGWTLYADNHDGSLPNPSAFTPAGWVKNVQNPYEYTPVEAPIEMQLEAIRNGVLFPYIESTDVYRCPVAQKNEMRTYSCSPTLGTEGFEGWPYVLKKLRNPLKRNKARLPR